MLRILLRLIGFVSLAAGFTALVLDGVRWLATGDLLFAKLRATAVTLAPTWATQIETAATRLHPLLWRLVLEPILIAPTFAVFGVLGFALLWIGRRPKPPIGFFPR